MPMQVQLLGEIQENKTTLSRAVGELAENARRTDEHQKLLQSLLFASIIIQRYSDTEEALSQTLRWLSEDKDATTFPQSLHSPSDLFWVSGLAGSGKSTLIKYAFTHPKTCKKLLSWAGE